MHDNIFVMDSEMLFLVLISRVLNGQLVHLTPPLPLHLMTPRLPEHLYTPPLPVQTGTIEHIIIKFIIDTSTISMFALAQSSLEL